MCRYRDAQRDDSEVVYVNHEPPLKAQPWYAHKARPVDLDALATLRLALEVPHISLPRTGHKVHMDL